MKFLSFLFVSMQHTLDEQRLAHDADLLKLRTNVDQRTVRGIFGHEDQLLFFGRIVYALERRLIANDNDSDLAVINRIAAAEKNQVAVHCSIQ